MKQRGVYTWLEKEDERIGESHVSEASFQRLRALLLSLKGLIFFLWGSRIADMMEQLARVQEKTREEHEALSDKVQQMTSDNNSLKRDNEKLKVSDSNKSLKVKC